jgi:hypothetical protein
MASSAAVRPALDRAPRLKPDVEDAPMQLKVNSGAREELAFFERMQGGAAPGKGRLVASAARISSE